MRALPFVLVAVLASACSTDRCKAGTVLLTVSLTNGAEAASFIDVTLSIDGGAAETKTLGHQPGSRSGSIEVDFGTYPSGKPLAFTVAARTSSQTLATTSQTATASPGCTALSFTLDASQAPSDDMAAADGANGDDLAAANVDLATPVVATARLVAPLSTSTVTQQAPTLHWQLGPGGGTPVVDVCKDRACSQLLSVTAPVASDNTSATPTGPLPAGWVFWRVRVVLGSQTTSSATWQLWVGKKSATTAVDSSSGAILDVNGDGYADFLVGTAGAAMAHLYLGGAGGTYQRIDIASPDAAGSSFGSSVASAGDVNGDGYGDFVVGAWNANRAHLYFGEPTPTASDWNGAAPPKRVDVVAPDAAGAGFGQLVAGTGDVNGDGFADFLVGAPNVASDAGAAHLYLGEATPTGSDWNGTAAANRVDLASPDGTGAFFGNSLAGAGDVNGDGYADFVIGSFAQSSSSGVGHVYFGEPAPAASDWNGAAPAKRIDLADPDGADAHFAFSVAGAGDVNGDGYADFLVGADGTSAGGAAHVYFGEATPSASDWNGATPAKRIDVSNPDGASAVFGIAVAGAGDVNGDGYADFLVGAYNVSSTSGAAHVYLGEATPAASDWSGTTPAKRVNLTDPDGAGAGFGSSVASAGDVNGDGYGDFLVGAPRASSNAGAASLYLGEQTPLATDWNATTPTKRVDFFDPDSAAAGFGTSLASADKGDDDGRAQSIGSSATARRSSGAAVRRARDASSHARRFARDPRFVLTEVQGVASQPSWTRCNRGGGSGAAHPVPLADAVGQCAKRIFAAGNDVAVNGATIPRSRFGRLSS